jgi:DNA-binding NarL/FixJ family response regulator
MGNLATRRSPAALVRAGMLVFSDRPALHAFFTAVSPASKRASVTLEAARTASLDGLGAAIVDVALEPAVGIEVCTELHRRNDDLPVAAVVCCPHAVNEWTLRGLIGSGVSAVLDLQASPAEAARLLGSVGRGASVLHVQLGGDRRQLLNDVLSPPGRRIEAEARLLELVAKGLPDHEIAGHLHLSPHTVKHRIEQLRHELGVRNRSELAAWAGRHGFYP